MTTHVRAATGPIVLLALAMLAPWAAGAPVTITFAPSELGTMVDPDDGSQTEQIDLSVADVAAGSGAGTFLNKTQINALADLQVVNFDTATGGTNADGPVDEIVAQYDAADISKIVDFSVVAGLGNAEVGYNYGSYTSGGRTAVSGTAAYHALGLIPGSLDPGTGLATNMLALDVAVANDPGRYVDVIGGVLIGRNSGSANAQYPIMTVSYMDLATLAANTSTLQYGGWLGGSGDRNQYFYGFQAPDGNAITRVSFDSNTSNVYIAFDDLAFRVTGEPEDRIPEPCTLSLLSLGGLLALARRRRR